MKVSPERCNDSSRALRSSYGSARSECPSMYNRSNATKLTGSDVARRRASRWFATCMRCCSVEKLGRPSSPSATISPSSTQVVIPRNSPISANSGKDALTSRSFLLCARTLPPSTKRIARTPSHLISKAQFSPSCGSSPATANIGLMDVGRGSVRVDGPWRWIIQLRSFVWNSTKSPLALEPWSDELDLGVGPLLHLVVAPVPNRHAAASVLSLGDVPLEGRVLEGMVLGVHGEAVLVGRLGEALGDGPRDQHAITLEPQVPVQAARMVLLDHEPLVPLPRRALAAHGLGSLPCVPLGPVRVELLRAPGVLLGGL